MDKTIKFINDAIEIHGDKYGYGGVNYVSTKKKIIIRCNEHGDFEQTPEKHLRRKQGCPRCAKNSKKPIGEVIDKLHVIHKKKIRLLFS